ncbi:hypothetical protein [Gelidibacter gilvus]|uniref:EthD domain-containing protein n=1 Tax=Gelidibacter gilvus TaxID=59602 RepID=A0A4Q0XH93_9FLAO|nr:hypothetical protein [Gelidibacter gilvus]RXJ50610.1 hypothetical protein ESZ48_07580 [Gelidibacter gilvus]
MTQTIVTRHKVGNIGTWLKGHQDRLDAFAPAISNLKTFQDTDNPNSVVMLIEVTDMEKFKAILNDPSLKALKDKHTVLETITVSMPIEVK